ncbi:hypothetical protein ACHQM5_008607 [Ranunculus cassubicifolius]
MAEQALFMQSQPQVWNMMWAFADSMALKCAVDLRIADIIHDHGCPITLQQLVSGINSPSTNLIYLSRIMRFLVYKNVFTAKVDSNGSETTLYGLTPAARWLLQDDANLSLAPMIQAQTHDILMSPWRYFSKCVEEGGDAFPKAHSSEIWDLASVNPEFNKTFNASMACTSKIAVEAILGNYEGFEGLESLVDVGGGTGMLIREIVKNNPHIRGIGFDLPHVVSTAPEFPGVEYIGGNMFREVPKADAVIIKSILHDWTDDECVTILKNCHRAIGKNGKKVIVVEVVLNPEGGSSFEDTGLALDLCMMAHTSGKERTEHEWKHILKDAGFPQYKLIQIPSLFSIIEAYPA